MPTRTKIKNLLNQKNWSAKCKRLTKFLNDYSLNIQDVKIKKTSDRNWMLKNARYRNVVAFDIIGFNTNSFTFVYVEKSNIKQK